MNDKYTSIKQIERAILTRKTEVILALENAHINVDSDIDENLLLKKIMDQLKNGNGYLVAHLTAVIMLDEPNPDTNTKIENAISTAKGLLNWLENLKNSELVILQAKSAASSFEDTLK